MATIEPRATSKTTHPDDRMLRLKEVLRMAGIGSSAAYEAMAKGQFPRSYRLVGRARGWKLSDIQQWIASREAA